MFELLTSEQMSKADRLTIDAGTTGFTLMERAGKAIAEQAMQLFELDSHILILCGPGNNGGDGLVTARLLQDQGIDVRVVLLGARGELKGDANLAAEKWTGPVVSFSLSELKSATGVIDALFGAGLTRDITGTAADMIRSVNEASLPVLAVDTPSGIDGSNGQVWGIAIKATRTISFFRAKPGHVLFPGREYCGPVEIADIGISAKVLDVIKPQACANDPALWRDCYPVPKLTDHKFKRGHAVVVSGGPDSTGAARLAALSALRTGAGLVTLASPPEALAINAAHLTSVMVKTFADTKDLIHLVEDQHKNCVVIGPGSGVNAQTCTSLLSLLDSNKALVIDADAITCFQEQPEQLFEAIRKRKAPTVLTPHDGEYQRLFNNSFPVDQPTDSSRLSRARTAAQMSGAVIILKGPDTVIADPAGRSVLNSNAPPSLATAGSGDVLAGIVGGLLAQNMPVFEAACAAVWLHGDAATDFGYGLISEDLPDLLPAALNKLISNLTMKG